MKTLRKSHGRRPTETPATKSATRRDFLVGLATAGLLAGCGRDIPAQPPASASRSVENAFGATEIPADPKRIAVLDQNLTLAALLSLGVIPTSALRQDLGRPPFPAFIPDELTRNIATIDAPDGEFGIEAVAGAAPDLIIADAGYLERSYDELTRLAPTVGMEYEYTDPYRDLRTVAAVFDRSAVADRIVGEVDGRLQATAQQVRVGTVTLMAVRGDNSLLFFSDRVWVGGAITTLGGTLTPTLDRLPGEPDVGGYVEASPEFLSFAAGEAILLLQQDSAEASTALDSVEKSPRWTALPAVREGRVLKIDNFAAQGVSGRFGFDHITTQLGEFFAR